MIGDPLIFSRKPYTMSMIRDNNQKDCHVAAHKHYLDANSKRSSHYINYI